MIESNLQGFHARPRFFSRKIHRSNISANFVVRSRDGGSVMRANGSTHLVITAIITVFSSFHVSSALAAQAKPLIKVMSGYGSTDGGAQILWFAKETKLFEKHG